MMSCLARGPLTATALAMALSVPATAQVLRPSVRPAAQVVAPSQVDLYATIRDESGKPLEGVVVSALGASTALAISDPKGRCTLRGLAPGRYIVRAHLPGYAPVRAHVVQVSAERPNVFAVELSRQPANEWAEPPPVLAAGVGVSEVGNTPEDSTSGHDHGEVAWRLRHLKRSVLKDVGVGLDGVDQGEPSIGEGSLAGLGRLVVTPARLATSVLTDIAVSGQFNLLTVTSFDKAEDFFSADGLVPNGIADLSLSASVGDGEWAMRGVTTQGDLASWILAGSFVGRAADSHRYEAGLSYAMQRYRGGNRDALAAMSEGSRNVGAVYVSDQWTVNPNISLEYGAKYARYDYLEPRGLLSPRASVTVRPSDRDELRIRGIVARRDIAPGAQEFLPPTAGLWLPPERTFSPVQGGTFRAERVEHVEIAVERPIPGDVRLAFRAFRQDIDDQLVTVFGSALSDGIPASSLGHFYVATGGDVSARGWGVSVARHFGTAVNAAVDYVQVRSRWRGASPDGATLALLVPSVLRTDRDGFHDVTTSVESVVPVTDTRFFVTYKINTGFVTSGLTETGRPTGRFGVHVKQVLPFMSFTNAQWEMLVEVRNIFNDDLVNASVYDELLVVEPPKHVIGGVTLTF